MAESTSDTEPEVSGIGVDEAWADAAIASVAVNEGQLCFAHLPCLWHELGLPLEWFFLHRSAASRPPTYDAT